MKKLVRLLLLFLLLFFPLTVYGDSNPYVLGGRVPVSGVTPEWSDGYESNDFTGWDQGETDTGGNFAVQSTVKRTGTYSAQFDHDAGTDAYAQEDLVSDLTEGYVVCYIRFSDVTAMDTANGQFRPIYCYDINDNLAMRAALWSTDGSPWDLTRINCIYYVDDGTYPGSATAAGYVGISPAIDTWYELKMYLKISSGANDGVFKVWFAGSLVHDVTGIDNDEQIGFSKYRVGNCYTEWLTDQGLNIFFDDAEIYSGAP